MKLLITGASGLFGSKLFQLASTKGIEVYSSDIQETPNFGNFVKLDITKRTKVEETFHKIKPDVVVHAASLTNVDQCELNKDLAWKINVDGTIHIVEAAKENEAFLVYISSDYIFSGEKGCYVESDSADPLNYYGLTKLEAETVVTQSLLETEYLIARPSVIYGSAPAIGKANFALWLVEKLRNGERVKIVTDQWNTPTLNTNLAEMTLEVIERRLFGILHMCGATRVSRYEFAQRIAEEFELEKSLIDKTLSSHFSWPAKRPTDSSLDTSQANRILICKPLALKDALKQLKTEISSNHNQ